MLIQLILLNFAASLKPKPMKKTSLFFAILFSALFGRGQSVSIGDILCTDGSTVKPEQFALSGKTAKGIVFYVDDTHLHGWAVHLYYQGSTLWSPVSYDIPDLPNYKTFREAINELLCESDIFALPSYNETFGLVYIEATAHQNAVIATKGTGIWGHFKENEETLYCDSYDSFQKMLYELIDNDTFRNQIAKRAFDKTSADFTWDKIIEKYSQLYENLL